MGKIRKLALVHDFLTSFTGAERVLATISEMYPEAPIYTLLSDRDICKNYFPNRTVYSSSLNSSPLKHKPNLLINQMPRAIEEFNFSDYDLVISSSGAFSHGIISGPHTTHICYCHSPARYLWDWHSEYLQEKNISTPLKNLFAETILNKIRIWDQVSAKRVDYWIANSNTVAKRIKKFYHADSQIIYPPVSFPDTSKPINTISNSTEPNYFVTVSRLTPNKRIDLIIEACSMANTKLKIIGQGNDLARLKKITKKLNTKVDFLGYVTEEQKFSILAGAQAFIFGAEDDFGIAPIEAMSCAIPVIAYSAGGTKETVINGKNGYLFEEPNANSIFQAILNLEKNKVEWSKKMMIEHSQKYSKKEFCKKFTEVIEALPWK